MKLRDALFPALVAILMAPGCNDPALSPEKVHAGMTEEQVIGLMGKPSRTLLEGDARYLEFETFDRDVWFGLGRKENIQLFYVRLINGRVESFGNKGASKAPLPPPMAVVVEQKPSHEKRDEVASVRPAAPGTFDLRSELEKLEKLKKDGLISEAEFKELRQRALEKARAQ